MTAHGKVRNFSMSQMLIVGGYILLFAALLRVLHYNFCLQTQLVFHVPKLAPKYADVLSLLCH